jgi:hypothetical protein
MRKQQIKNHLIELFNQLENEGRYDSGTTALEVMRIIEYALKIIDRYQLKSKAKNEVKKQTLNNLNAAYIIASRYYEIKYGFDVNTNINSKIVPHIYVNKTYNSLDYFIHKIFNE